MERQSGLCGRECCVIPILHLDGTSFQAPIFAFEHTDLRQLLVVIGLVLGVKPALDDNFNISLEA